MYPYNPETESDPEQIERAFSNAKYLIKSGEVIINDSEIISNGNKQTYWVDVKTNASPQVEHDLTEMFRKYYTVSERNYEVEEKSFMKNPNVIAIDATL